MINIDTHEKYIDGEPNAYYEGFVADSDFYKGYRFAMDNLADILDAMPVDLFEDIEIPMVKAILNQTARRCSDYISETMEYDKDEMVMWLIDKMPASEWNKKRTQLFGSELDSYEKHEVCSEGTGVSNN